MRHLAAKLSSPKVRELHDTTVQTLLWRERALGFSACSKFVYLRVGGKTGAGCLSHLGRGLGLTVYAAGPPLRMRAAIITSPPHKHMISKSVKLWFEFAWPHFPLNLEKKRCPYDTQKDVNPKTPVTGCLKPEVWVPIYQWETSLQNSFFNKPSVIGLNLCTTSSSTNQRPAVNRYLQMSIRKSWFMWCILLILWITLIFHVTFWNSYS